MSDEELLKRAADDLESAAEFVGLEGNFSAAKDYLDTVQRIRERLARRAMTTQTMIEKVGSAISRAIDLNSEAYSGTDFDAVARAALQALREPTCLMIEATNNVNYDTGVTHPPMPPLVAWRTMIDAALQEKGW